MLPGGRMDKAPGGMSRNRIAKMQNRTHVFDELGVIAAAMIKSR